MILRRILLTLSIALALCASARAQTKLSELPAATAATSDDLLVVVDSPASSAATKKITFADFSVSLFGSKTTTDLAEGTNLYWTTARFNSALGGKSTTDLAEGTNLYFTNGRADGRITNALGVTVQAFSSHLSAIAGLSPSADDVLQFKSGAWTNRTMGQLKADLSFSFSDLSGTASKAQQHASTVYIDQANTFSAGAQDFSSASSLKIPAGAGATPSVAGQVAYDSTANAYKGHNGTAAKTFAFTDSNITGNAATANALAANGSNCSAGNAAAGVDASGAAEGCAALPANTASTASQFFTAYNSTTGAFTKAQPAASDVSGLAASATTDTTNAANIASGTLDKNRVPGTLNATTAPSLTVSGTAGAGFAELPEQSSAPSTPTNALRVYADSSNRLSWKGENGFARTFDGTSNTADRIYLLPDRSATVATTTGALTSGNAAKFDSSGNVVDGGVGLPVYARVTGSNATTTSASLVDITGLSVALSASTTYEVEVWLSVNNSADTNGIQFALQYSAVGATVEAQLIGTFTATAVRTDRLSAFNTASGNRYVQASGIDGVISIKGAVTTGVNAGNLTAQYQKPTAGTATVRVGSFLKVTKIQ